MNRPYELGTVSLRRLSERHPRHRAVRKPRVIVGDPDLADRYIRAIGRWPRPTVARLPSRVARRGLAQIENGAEVTAPPDLRLKDRRKLERDIHPAVAGHRPLRVWQRNPSCGQALR